MLLCSSTSTTHAATLHGRVKDRQCTVLSRATVHIRSTRFDRTVITDDAGNYIADLPAGEYHLCVQREQTKAETCRDLVMPLTGDTYITTQLLDAAPDLSNLGNRTY